jgi:DNA-directed RNA polymerase specialized sigma24 family protein
MRRILIDNARSANSLPRRRFELIGCQTDLSVRPVSETLIIHILLERLATINMRLYQIVKLRFFLGLSNGEIASILSVSARTVKRDWVSARLRLQRELANSTLRKMPPA